MKRALLLAFGIACAVSPAEVVHEESSLYGRILVIREGGLLCMKFTGRSEQRRQSCIDERAPQKMALHYTRMMMASLLLAPKPTPHPGHGTWRRHVAQGSRSAVSGRAHRRRRD